jgi:nicotinate-nucleotide pyrophosphorylase (carboxylating)
LGLEFRQIHWDESLRADVIAMLRLAVREDLGRAGDATSKALILKGAMGAADVVARQAGILAGLPAAEIAAHLVDPSLQWMPQVADGQPVAPGDGVASLAGPVRSILAAERLVLNLLTRLSGIATLTRRYVDAVAGTRARIYDTRKTTPGWRRLEKYAVRMGGGCNHRAGLYDAILIKDNHLAFGRENASGKAGFSPAEAVHRARRWSQRHAPSSAGSRTIVEIEVDSLTQLDDVLPARPDLVLLDNMAPEQLRQAVARRDAVAPEIELEASGGVTLDTVGQIARTGVDRISVGALTHSPPALDFGLDWAQPSLGRL